MNKMTIAAVLAAMSLAAQAPAPGAPAGPAFVRPAAYPERPPVAVRGGEGGPNLLRSELVLNDKRGELIGKIVANGQGEMPAIKLSDAAIGDIADYIHAFQFGGYDITRNPPPTILVGDAKAGEQAFTVTLRLPNGPEQTFRRDGDTPRVVINDPMQAHKQLFTKYRDEDIHNLTSYLVTVK